MLAAQLKTMASTDVVSPLQAFIRSEYSESDSNTYQDALMTLSQLRKDVGNIKNPSSISRHVLLRYYGQLELTQSRFPISETKVRLPFTWHDSFSPKRKVTQYSVKFEQAALLFNLAALESQAGVQQDRSDVSGLKTACKHFMQAAGGFQYVLETIGQHVLGQRTPDLTPDGLQLLIQLMLGQAQACFYEKAVKDKMIDSIKAKLANQAVVFYQSALDHARSSTMATVLDRLWAVHLQFQIYCLRAASQYWQSKASKTDALKAGTGYGEEIARLRASIVDGQAAVAVTTQNRLPPALASSVQHLLSIVKTNLSAAEKDNNSIYLESIPKNLTAIGVVCMVKAIQPTEGDIAAQRGRDLFEGLFPNSLRQRAEAFKAEMAEKVKISSRNVTKMNEDARSQLASMGLPGAVEAHEGGDAISDAMWSQIASCQQEGLLNMLDNAVCNHAVSAKEVEGHLREVGDMLGGEEMEDNTCRDKYGSDWTATPSSTLNESFRSDVDRYYKLLSDAKRSDATVQRRLEGKQEAFQALDLSRAEIEESMPQSNEDAISVDTSILSELMIQLGSLFQDREQQQEEYSAACEKHDPVDVLVSANGRDVEELLAEEKRNLQAFEAPISATQATQASLLADIVQHEKVFQRARQSDPITLERERRLQDIVKMVNLFEELKSNVREGTTFYRDLTSRVEQLRQTVRDHCSARQLQQRELELQCSQMTTSLGQTQQDAAFAQQMANGMQISQPTGPVMHADQDAAYAAQLAGDVSQQYDATPSDPEATKSSGFRFSSLFGGKKETSPPSDLKKKDTTPPPPLSAYPGQPSHPQARPPPPYQPHATPDYGQPASQHSHHQGPGNVQHQGPGYGQPRPAPHANSSSYAAQGGSSAPSQGQHASAPPREQHAPAPYGQHNAPRNPSAYGQHHYVDPSSGQYAAPPTGRQEGPPAGQYGAPSAGQYGAPPAGQYAPPPGQHYTAPSGHQEGPQAGQYGAPSTGQYSSPPGGQSRAPPAGQYAPPPGQHYTAPSGQHHTAPSGQHHPHNPNEYGQQQPSGQPQHHPHNPHEYGQQQPPGQPQPHHHNPNGYGQQPPPGHGQQPPSGYGQQPRPSGYNQQQYPGV